MFRQMRSPTRPLGTARGDRERLAVATAVGAMGTLGFAITSPILPDLAPELGVSRSAIGLVQSASYIVPGMAEVIEYAAAPIIERGDGIQSVRLTDPPLPGQRFVMGITSFPPGTALALHSHNTVEQVTVLEGSALVELEGRRQLLRPYDTTQVPAGLPHRFANAGDGPMRILWVYGDTEVTRTFTETGETVSQLASRCPT